MLFIFVLFFLVAFLSALTTIPLSIAMLVICTVIFRKSWVFFMAFGLGLLLDLYSLRHLGYTSLIFAVLVFTLFLYERKFETQTLTFVFAATFLGSLIYLMVFGYNNVLTQSLANAAISIFLFKFLISNFKFKMNS